MRERSASIVFAKSHGEAPRQVRKQNFDLPLCRTSRWPDLTQCSASYFFPAREVIRVITFMTGVPRGVDRATISVRIGTQCASDVEEWQVRKQNPSAQKCPVSLCASNVCLGHCFFWSSFVLRIIYFCTPMFPDSDTHLRFCVAFDCRIFFSGCVGVFAGSLTQ